MISFDDTICALSTAPGMAGLAVIRVSGRDAIAIVARRWRGAALAEMATHTAHLGTMCDSDGQTLDQVVLTLFRGPGSFTGEDVIELSCHGSPLIQQHLLATLVEVGCRMATGGEFTRRAVMSGRLDLSQAEAVADVIAARSRASLRLALNQMRGGLASAIAELRQRLLRFVALMELELDFSEEDVEFADRGQLRQLADDIAHRIGGLTRSFSDGNAIKQGIPVAIVGQTNAGKSTLLNALLRDDRALVSDMPGTTRDLIEDTLIVGGALLRLTDTAGLRHSHDSIEQMGIERSLQRLSAARIVLWVIDATSQVAEVARLAGQIVPECVDKHLIAVVNKCDLDDAGGITSALPQWLPDGAPVVTISAHDPDDVARVECLLAQAARLPQIDDDTVIVTNVRHHQALLRARQSLARAIDGMRAGLPGDLLSQDIRECLLHLGEITGEITTHEVLGEIFANFCVGK